MINGYATTIFNIRDNIHELGQCTEILLMVVIYTHGELGREVDVEKALQWEAKL